MQRMLAAVETGCRLQLVKHLFRLASMTFISVNFFSFFMNLFYGFSGFCKIMQLTNNTIYSSFERYRSKFH